MRTVSIGLLLVSAALLAACEPPAAREPTPDELACADPKAVPRVSFRFEDDSVTPGIYGPNDLLPPGAEFMRGLEDEPYVVRRKVEVSGRAIADVRLTMDPDSGRPSIMMRLDEAGAAQFKTATTRGVGRRIAVVVDGVVITAPTINEPIGGGGLVIGGAFTMDQAEALAARIKVAARGCVLPPAAPVQPS